MQVDAFQLAVETPSPQVQQRRRHAADTPLGIGLAALGITDPLVPDAVADEAEADADELAGVDADRTGTVDAAEPAITAEAACDTPPGDRDATSPVPVAVEDSSIPGADASHADASHPEGAHAEAAQETVHGTVQAAMSDDPAGPNAAVMPASGTEPAQAPVAEPEPSSRPGGAMALGLSRRRSSMVAPAPVAVTASRWGPLGHQLGLRSCMHAHTAALHCKCNVFALDEGSFRSLSRPSQTLCRGAHAATRSS